MSATSTATLPAASADAAHAAIPDPHVVVLFGASGDLAARKLLPGFFHLEGADLLPDAYRIVGTATDDLDDAASSSTPARRSHEFSRTEVTDEAWERFAARLSYVPISAGTEGLATAVSRARQDIGGESRLLHYLAVPPAAFESIVGTLKEAGLNGPEARVILEKPFGHDYDSAVELNETLHEAFDDSQIFRIDHFLGKEAVQNILALRFANGLYEPLWNRNNIEFVQIDVPETLSIGHRAGFYEGTGAYRDMVVTHLLQLLSYIAMEPPAALSAKALREEKNKVMQAFRMIDPDKVVRGQYEGYLDEPGVAPESNTETFVAVEVEIDNWRWAGVPFYLRTGKCMAESRHMVVLDFREPAMRMFPNEVQHQGANQLVFELTEPGSITADFQAKVPGRDDGARAGADGVPLRPVLPGRSPARGLRAADPRRDARRRDAVHERRGHRAALGDQRRRARSPRAHPHLLRDSWGPQAAQDLVAPNIWRLPEADFAGN